MRCSLACSSCQLLKWSKIANSATVAEEWKKQGRLQHCLLLCFVLLTEAQNKLLAVKWVTDVVSMFDFLYDL